MKEEDIATLKGLGCQAVYVACPIHGQDAAFALRNEVVAALRGHSKLFVLPFYSDLPEVERDGLNIYEFDMARVRQADLVVAVLTGPSTGVGLELREAHECDVPVRVFASPRDAASGIVHHYLEHRGLPKVISWEPGATDGARAARLIADEVLRWLDVHPEGHGSIDGSAEQWRRSRVASAT